jgi:protein SCO1/2
MDGRLVRFSGLAGKLVAVNFIYTRCPLPDVCPRLAASFASLQRAFRDEMPSRLMLLSITLDPDFDVPDVLAGYARSARADPRCWRFLTGDVAPAARQFGVAYWVEEGLIAHSSATAIIGPDQRLRAIVEGSSFPLEQLAALIGFELDRMKK